MKEFNFKFGNGSFVVSTDDGKKQSVLDSLQVAQNTLLECLPHRKREIDSFIIACVDEILLSK